MVKHFPFCYSKSRKNKAIVLRISCLEDNKLSILQVKGLQKTYITRFGGNKVEVLKNVNFSVEKGEYVAIMGESGSGKTTLLNMLAALDKPTGGSILLDGQELSKIKEPDEEGVRKGFANLDKHIRNLRSFGQTVAVCFNKYASDTDIEIEMVREHCKEIGVPFALNNAYAEGGEGAADLARLVVETIENNPSGDLKFTYEDCMGIKEKIERIAKGIYGAATVNFSATASKKIAAAQKMGFCHFPVCIAKTQYSFSQDPNAYGAPEGFDFEIQDIVINTGSEMIVAIAGSIIRMPGLPKYPQAMHIDIVNGEIEGLS